ncbi:death-inducer obliterator 1 isoform X1 [Vigna radiata var. radiata]|uniref:Death-inducer obliterator 1 isoform X1 n=1 Tax=Vigna radiata var. radiata TaxID=3916 RepID=A0A3Q0F298_VIGRR|nr:death-inducer obliterator 1 isoform X1 [Vigna radiata var. radiata]
MQLILCDLFISLGIFVIVFFLSPFNILLGFSLLHSAFSAAHTYHFRSLHQEPMPSMQMARLEPLMNKIDSSGRQMEMGILVPVSSDIVSQPMGTSNEHVGLLRAVPGESRSQGMPLSTMQSGRVEAQANNPGMHQIHYPNQQSMQMGRLPNSAGPQQQQQPATPKRKAPTELSSSSSFNKRAVQMGNRPWLQQVPNASNRGSPHMHMQSSSIASRTQHSAASSKRKTQFDSTSGKASTPRSVNSKSQNTQIKQSSKVQTESSESVRSKMRESLAAALALVSQQGKPQIPNNNTPTDGATNTQGKLENNSQCSGSTPTSINGPLEQSISQSVSSSFAEADSVGRVETEHMQNTSFKEDFPEKYKDYEAGSTNASNSESILTSMQVLNCDKQDFQSCYTLTTDDVPFSDSFFMKDDLLQGNGLSWVLSDMVDVGNQKESQTNIEQRSEPEETCQGCKVEVPLPELLASKIEAELFKLFGGVNKKYKEKGRSLLFNLKDRNNPELRERVMFGQIPPEQLCSMTAEELASKELSEWRIAKAEELAQMVVLPNSDVDFRRLVKKTHKGEFQVEVEHEDNVSVEEVSGGTTSVARSQTEKKDVEGTSSKPDVNIDAEKRNLQKDDTFSITISSTDGTDPMQGLMTDDALKDPDFLPPIVSLDEFMESLHSEPPFENLESGKVTPALDKDDLGVGFKSKSSDLTSNEQAVVTPDKFQSTRVNSDAEKEKKADAESGTISSDTGYSGSQADMKSTDGRTKERSIENVKPAPSDTEFKGNQSHAEGRYGNDNKYMKDAVPTKGECLWEGMLQPNISTTQSVISFYKSGEKTAAKDWPGFLEIKGRVRLDAFEKFLQDLRFTRSRAIMVSHFLSKELDEQSTLREVADSYISDERVGFAEPVLGVELYFCPPHKKTVEMLSNILPKEQIEAVNSIDNGLIGIIVWRKTNITSISPTTATHHKHSSKRQQYFSRRQQDINVNANSTHKAVPPTDLKTIENENDDDDDVPPGFGPPAARVEDDLPEFNFSSSSIPPHLAQKPKELSNMVTSHSVNPAPPPARPVEQMRELVYKYGQNKPSAPSVNWQDKFGGTIQPWNDDDDDIPEWQPQTSQNQFLPQQTMHNFHLRPHIMNQSLPGSQQQPIMTPQYLQPPVNVTHTQRNFDPQWVPSSQASNLPPRGGPPYGAPSQGTTWPQNVSRSRGF